MFAGFNVARDSRERFSHYYASGLECFEENAGSCSDAFDALDKLYE